MKDEMLSFKILIDELEASPGYKIIQEIELLKRTNYVFIKNFDELMFRINEYENDTSMFHVKNRPNLNLMHLEILRLLHNYVSSVLTSIDHSRNLRNRVSEKRIDHHFKAEIEKLGVRDVVTFMKLLRNYVQHYKLPVTNAVYSANLVEGTTDQYVTEQKMQLNVDDLLNWKGWNRESKRYLKSFGDKVEIKVFCEEYFKIILKFYEGFYDIILRAYASEIAESEELKSRLREFAPDYFKSE